MKWSLGVALACLLVAGGAVAQGDSSVPVDAEFEVDGPAVIVGDVDLDAVLAGVLFHPAEGSGFVAGVQDATVRAINVPYRVVMMQDSSVVGKNWVAVGEEPELLWEKSFSGTIELAELGGPESTIRVLPGGAGIDHEFQGKSLKAGAPMRFPTAAVDDRAALRSFSLHPVDSRTILPEGVYAVVDGGNESFRGPLRAVLYGGEFLVEGTNSVRVATGHSLNSTISDPLGQAGAWRYDRIVLLVDAPTASVTMVEEGGHLELLVQRLIGSVCGDVALHGVDGTARSGEGMSSGRFALAQLVGNLTVDAEYDSTTGWNVGGEASYLALDANPVVGSRIGAPSGGLVEAAAVSLLFLVVYGVYYVVRRGTVWTLVQAAKVKGWFLLAPLAARLDMVRLLKFSHRGRILQFFESNGVMPLTRAVDALAAQLEISASTVRHHLCKLDEGDQLCSVGKGRRRYVGPNHGNLGGRAVEVGLALTSEEPGRCVASAVWKNPGLNQQNLATSVRDLLGRDVSRVAVLKRAEEFVDFPDEPVALGRRKKTSQADVPRRRISLIRKERDGRNVRYWPTKSLDKVMRLRSKFDDESPGTTRRQR